MLLCSHEFHWVDNRANTYQILELTSSRNSMAGPLWVNRAISSVVRALPLYPMNGHRQTGPSCPADADSNDLQRAIAPAKASRGGNAALRAIRLRMYSASRMPSGAENQMQIRSEAVL